MHVGCTLSNRRNPRAGGQALSLAREGVAGRPFLHLVSDHVYLSDAPETCGKAGH